MTRNDIKQAFISILIGAVIAFLTTFLEGLINFLDGAENNILGSVAGGARYIVNRVRYFE